MSMPTWLEGLIDGTPTSLLVIAAFVMFAAAIVLLIRGLWKLALIGILLLAIMAGIYWGKLWLESGEIGKPGVDRIREMIDYQGDRTRSKLQDNMPDTNRVQNLGG